MLWFSRSEDSHEDTKARRSPAETSWLCAFVCEISGEEVSLLLSGQLAVDVLNVLDPVFDADSGPFFVERQVDFFFDLLKRFAGVDGGLNFLAKFDEVPLLSFDEASV